LKTLIEFWGYLECRPLHGYALVFLCLILSVTSITAQVDSLRVQEDTIRAEVQPYSDTVKVRRLDPRKALFYAAALPGLGQIYNGKYWKLPLVYGGFVGGVLAIKFYQDTYTQYRNDLYIFLATKKLPPNRTEENLRYIVNRARRERDYVTILTGMWYILQIVDAHVDAHLDEFKWTKETKISLHPSVEQNMMVGRTAGLSLTFKF
jgi:Family of unknown function (DUF5683)